MGGRTRQADLVFEGARDIHKSKELSDGSHVRRPPCQPLLRGVSIMGSSEFDQADVAPANSAYDAGQPDSAAIPQSSSSFRPFRASEFNRNIFTTHKL